MNHIKKRPSSFPLTPLSQATRNCLTQIQITRGARDLLSAGLLGLATSTSAWAGFPAVIELAELAAAHGAVINGAATGQRSGWSVSHAGDFNGDGHDDIIIGAPTADVNGPRSGQSHVLFGGPGFAENGLVELREPGVGRAITIRGASTYDRSGWSVGWAGDINGDGFDDLIIGAPGEDYVGHGRSYVVFGGPDIGSLEQIELAGLDGSNGFALTGNPAGHNSGWSVSRAGDVNGDGFDDLIIGSPFASANGWYSGQSHVVFGGPALGKDGVVDLAGLPDTAGLVINGSVDDDRTGFAVAAAGDINGDGFDDLIIGGPRWASPYASEKPDGYDSGWGYVVFGASNLAGSLRLNDLYGGAGFAIRGQASDDLTGVSVSRAGDLNDDGFDDLIIGAPAMGPDNAGAIYVVFGGPGIGGAGLVRLRDLNGANGFTIRGLKPGDRLGYSVAGAGDVNGDGIADLVIGAASVDPNGVNSGQVYVIFGGAGLGHAGVFELSGLDGDNGFTINGMAPNDLAGWSVGPAGDLNGDGSADLIIGAPGARPNGDSSGQTYVLYGRADMAPPEPQPEPEPEQGSLPRVLSLGDSANDGSNRIASLARQGGGTIARLSEASDGSVIGEIMFGEGLRGLDAAVLPNLGGSPAREIAVLGSNRLVEVRDSLSGALLSELAFTVDPLRMSYVEHAGAPAIAVLGRNAKAEVQVEVRHALNASLLARIDYASGLEPVGIIALEQGPGQSAIGVLGENHAMQGYDRIEIRDIAGGLQLQQLSQGKQFSMHRTLKLPISDVGSRIVTLRSNARMVNVAVHDPQQTRPIAQIGFAPTLSPRAVIALPDINGNGSPEVAVLGRRDDGVQRLVIKDSESRAILARAAVEQAAVVQDMTLIPDMNRDGAPDIAILGQRADAQLILFIHDGRSGAQLQAIEL